ncbi:hypothetical protein HPB47_014739, partial [Ixodes persulcatus]
MKMQEAMRLQKLKSVRLEDRGNRANFVVFRIKDCSEETEALLRHDVIKEVFLDKLG